MSGEHIRGIPRTYEKEITLADTPYTLSVGFNCVKVDTTGGNVKVNLPNVNYPIDVIKTSSDSYIVTVWVGGVQKATVAGELSKITIENAEVTKDEPWYPYDCIVGIAGISGDGGEVLAKDRFGRVIAGGRGVAGTDDSTVIQMAISSLTSGRTWQEVVAFSDNIFQPSVAITMPDYTILRLNGSVIKLKANSNCNVIQNSDQVTNGNAACAIIGNGVITSDSQNGVGPYHGISWKIPGTPIPRVGGESPVWPGWYALVLNGISVTSINGAACKLDNSYGAGPYFIDACEFRYGSYSIDANGSGLYLKNVSDSVFRGIVGIVGQYHGIYIEYGTSNVFEDIYVAGTAIDSGIYINSAQRNLFNAVRVDASRKHSWYIGGVYGTQKCIFTGCRATTTADYLGADNTYDGFHLTGGDLGYSSNNTFNGCQVHGWDTVANDFRYGINEANINCNRNSINGFTYSSCDAGPIHLQGSLSIYSGIVGYNSVGSSTGTGSEQPIPHGLIAIPVGCKAWKKIEYPVGSGRYITIDIPYDATNVYPTVDNGVAFEWGIA